MVKASPKWEVESARPSRVGIEGSLFSAGRSEIAVAFTVKRSLKRGWMCARLWTRRRNRATAKEKRNHKRLSSRLQGSRKWRLPPLPPSSALVCEQETGRGRTFQYYLALIYSWLAGFRVQAFFCRDFCRVTRVLASLHATIDLVGSSMSEEGSQRVSKARGCLHERTNRGDVIPRLRDVELKDVISSNKCCSWISRVT